MTANELMKRYNMQDHVEHGAFLERHYAAPITERALSGLMYYYVAPGERTQFHRIDCDEYWCYAAGAPLELWMLEENGRLSTAVLGVEDGCEPVIFVMKGLIFAAKSLSRGEDGTFLSCITVPRFSADALELFSEDDILARCPEVCRFYQD